MYGLLLTLLFLSLSVGYANVEYTLGELQQGDTAVEEICASIMYRESMVRFSHEEPSSRHRPFVDPDRHLRPQNPESPEVAALHTLAAKDLSEDDLTVRSPQTAGTSFTAATLSDTFVFPPDSMGAVGPQQFILAINGRIKTFNKTTGLYDGVLSATLENFFNSVRVGFSITDPRIRYDRHAQRWVVVAVNFPGNNNRIVIAVSDGPVISNATVWRYFFFFAGSGCFQDYPTLGVDRHALYIGGQSFCNSSNAKVFVVKKSSILSTGPIQFTTFSNLIDLSTGVGLYVPQGVDNFDTNSTEGYFIGVDNAFFGRLVLRRVLNPGGTPSLSSNILITVPSTAYPIVVNHLGNTGGTAGRLDGIDDRLMCAHVRNGHLWTVHNLGMRNTGVSLSSSRTRNGCRWYELDVTQSIPPVLQAGTFFNQTSLNNTTDLSYWMPSIMTSGQGHMALGCSVAGANHFVDGMAVGRLATSSVSTTLTPLFLTAATQSYNPSNDRGGSEGRRWGDYSYTSLDPSDDMTMWTIQEFVSARNIWGVRVVKLLAPPPATMSSVVPSSVARGQSSVNVTVNGTATNGAGFFDPGAGFTNRISASVTRGVVVNSVTYVSPTQITLNLRTIGATAGQANVTVTNPDGQVVMGTNVLTIT